MRRLATFLSLLLLASSIAPLASARPARLASETEDRATLVVAVETTGGDGAFPFTATGGRGLPESFTLATEAGEASVAFEVRPGTFGLAQAVPDGWTLEGASCDDGSWPANVTLAAGEVVTCTFVDARWTGLVVRVLARGGDATFTFRGTGDGLPAWFNLTTRNGTASLAFPDLETNRSYGLRQVLPAGWHQLSATCTSGRASNFTLRDNESVTCTFEDTLLASLRVRVESDSGDASFAFTATGGEPLRASFRVTTEDGAGEALFLGLEPGVRYEVSPTNATGWRLASAACSSGAPRNVTPAPGDEVTCTFSFTRLAEVNGVVYRDADRDGRRDANESGLAGWTVYVDRDRDGRFDAGEPNATTDANGTYAIGGLEAGTYRVREVVQAGWRPTSPSGGTANVTLAAGAVATRSFGNAPTTATPPPPADGDEDEEDDDKGRGKERNAAGLGFWKHATKHHAAEQVTAWVKRIHAESAWLMPAGFTADADGAMRLVGEHVKCGKWDREECERMKFESRYLVLRLNLASGRLAADDTVRLDGRAADLLGLGRTATVAQVIDAIEDVPPAGLDEKDYRALRNAVQVGGGEGEDDD